VDLAKVNEIGAKYGMRYTGRDELHITAGSSKCSGKFHSTGQTH
jgi:hypothetical protein